MMSTYTLEKWIWTKDDFDQMGWHDSTVYGIRLNQNLELDIDYIFQWNQPEIEGFHFTFWVAPATLVFEKPKDITFELTQSFDDKWLEIQDIELQSDDGVSAWTIITQQGEIFFKASSFRQIIRKAPSLQLSQSIPYDERGGFSFEQTTGESLKEGLRPEIAERRRRDLEYYELAKRKFDLRKKFEALGERRDAGQVKTKDYLIEKKELKERIDNLTIELRGSRYEQM